MSERVSATIVTLNESRRIKRCVDALSFCDEVLVVDCGSTDGTREIARACGARVLEHAWEGFGPQKRYAVAQAAHDWILSVDADEVVSAALATAVRNEMSAPRADAYTVRRHLHVFGRRMRFSGTRHERVVRLFRRDRAGFTDDLVHERVLVTGTCADLAGGLEHYSFDCAEDLVAKVDRYSTAGARQAYARGRRSHPVLALAGGAFAFLRTYLLRLGVLDGWPGLALAIANGEGVYYRHLKLWLIARDAAAPGERPC